MTCHNQQVIQKHISIYIINMVDKANAIDMIQNIISMDWEKIQLNVEY